MKEKKTKSEEIFIATFGHFGKEISVECIKRDGKYYEIKNGQLVPEWAKIVKK